jgi:hypothetical protein
MIRAGARRMRGLIGRAEVDVGGLRSPTAGTRRRRGRIARIGYAGAATASQLVGPRDGGRCAPHQVRRTVPLCVAPIPGHIVAPRGSVAGPLPRSCARPRLPGYTASHGSTHEQQTPVSRLDPIHLAARTLAPASALVPRAPPRRRETCLSDAQVGETLRCAAGPISSAVLSSTPPPARSRPRPRPSWR